MKKLIFIPIITLIVAFIAVITMLCLDGCSSEPSTTKNIETNIKLIHGKHFDVEVVEDLGGGSLVVVDKNTNVMYLFVKGYESSAMTPIYNSDGTPVLWKDGTK